MKWLKSGSIYPLQVKRPKFGRKALTQMDCGMVEYVEVDYALAFLCGLDLLSGFHIENVYAHMCHKCAWLLECN